MRVLLLKMRDLMLVFELKMEVLMMMLFFRSLMKLGLSVSIVWQVQFEDVYDERDRYFFQNSSDSRLSSREYIIILRQMNYMDDSSRLLMREYNLLLRQNLMREREYDLLLLLMRQSYELLLRSLLQYLQLVVVQQRQVLDMLIIVSGVLGLENWEMYDDMSELEVDVFEVYYVKVRVVQQVGGFGIIRGVQKLRNGGGILLLLLQ